MHWAATRARSRPLPPTNQPMRSFHRSVRAPCRCRTSHDPISFFGCCAQPCTFRRADWPRGTCRLPNLPDWKAARALPPPEHALHIPGSPLLAGHCRSHPLKRKMMALWRRRPGGGVESAGVMNQVMPPLPPSPWLRLPWHAIPRLRALDACWDQEDEHPGSFCFCTAGWYAPLQPKGARREYV